jgi:hypothetical protein
MLGLTLADEETDIDFDKLLLRLLLILGLLLKLPLGLKLRLFDELIEDEGVTDGEDEGVTLALRLVELDGDTLLDLLELILALKLSDELLLTLVLKLLLPEELGLELGL